MNLKQAKEEGKLEEFIKEHENDPPCDKELMTKTLENMEKAEPSLEETRSPNGKTSA